MVRNGVDHQAVLRSADHPGLSTAIPRAFLSDYSDLPKCKQQTNGNGLMTRDDRTRCHLSTPLTGMKKTPGMFTSGSTLWTTTNEGSLPIYIEKQLIDNQPTRPSFLECSEISAKLWPLARGVCLFVPAPALKPRFKIAWKNRETGNLRDLIKTKTRHVIILLLRQGHGNVKSRMVALSAKSDSENRTNTYHTWTKAQPSTTLIESS